MSKEVTEVDPVQAMQELRRALDELGAQESINTAIAFKFVQMLGNAMRESYSKRKVDSVQELVALSEKYKSKEGTIALGALVDAFLIGWIGADKLK